MSEVRMKVESVGEELVVVIPRPYAKKMSIVRGTDVHVTLARTGGHEKQGRLQEIRSRRQRSLREILAPFRHAKKGGEFRLKSLGKELP